MGAVLLAALSAQTQEHVWLVPQLVTTGIISTVAFSKDGRFLIQDQNTQEVVEVRGDNLATNVGNRVAAAAL